MAERSTNNDLDAMHQLLHIKLKWKLTERELEHIERVFAMFDVPAVGAIDRRVFPYAMKRLRFTDKSKRRGTWASQQVIKEVLNGSYPKFAQGEADLSYLAYVDAVGRAKDELINADDAGRGAAQALQRLSITFGMSEEPVEKDPVDESGLWEKSVEYVSKRHIANAAEVFQQALKSSTSTVHGPRRILRKDLTPVLCALKPGLTDKDVQSLCELCKITGRNGLNFTDVVMMVGYVEMASNTLGGISKIYQDQRDALMKAEIERKKQSQGLFSMLGGAVSDSQAEFQRSSQAASAQLSSNATSATQGVETGISGVFSGASDGINQGSSFFAINGVNAVSLAAAAVAEAEAAATSATNAANAVLSTGSGGDTNRRVLVKEKKLEEAKKKAADLAELAAKSTGEEKAKAAALAVQAANDPVFSKQVIGNWFKTKAGGESSWRSALESVFNHFDVNGDGLINKEEFSDMLDELELDIDDEEAFARFDEVDVDESGEISLDEFERFFEVLIREWRAQDFSTDKRIQDQYRPLLSLYEPDDGVFGNNGDGQRKGFLRLMSRNGYIFWSDKPAGEALAAGHWSARLGMDDAREAFELAASQQTGVTVEGGVAGTRCSRLAMLRFVRMHAPDELTLSDAEFDEMVWIPHVLSGTVGLDKQDMDLAGFRSFCNDPTLLRYFQQKLREKKGIKDPIHQTKTGAKTTGHANQNNSIFGGLFSGLSTSSKQGSQSKMDTGNDESAWREAFAAVDLDGSGDLDLEEITLLLTVELEMPLNEDEIHALFLKYDTHMNESIEIEEFIGLMRDAKRLLSATEEERERELLGWGNTSQSTKTVKSNKEKPAQREMSRKVKDEYKVKAQSKLRRAKSKSTYSGDNVDLDKLKREVSSKLAADAYAPITLEEVSDLAHGGLELEGVAKLGEVFDVGPAPPGITTVLDENYETDEGGTDDEGGNEFEEFNAHDQVERERSRKMDSEKKQATSGAVQSVVGMKKSYAEIEADLDADLMSDLKSIFEKCLKNKNDSGLDVDGFVLATKELRLDLAEWRVKETFEEFDTDNSGTLDFEEFVELAAMKMVEKWAVKGGRAFLADEGNAANAIKTNAKRQLSVGEIMGEVMDNKANEEYTAAKARFHVEEILLIEEAFIAMAKPSSRRGRVKTMKLKQFTIMIGVNAREHDLAVLAAETDPQDTRTFALPDIIIALAKLQHVWRKVDGQLHDFRSDQETLDDETLMACNRAFKRSVRQMKYKVEGIPLMECRMISSAFRLLGFVIDPALANLWVMDLHLGHEAAADAANAEAIVIEYREQMHEKKEQLAKDNHGGAVSMDLEEEPEEVRLARLEAAAAKKSRRWVSYSDFLNLVGRYLHDIEDVEEEVKHVTKTGVMDMEITTTSTVKKRVPRKKLCEEEEAMPPAKRNVSLASCYRLPYDTLMMAMGLYDSVEKESSAQVSAYHLKIMFRRLSWRIGVKPTAAQIDQLAVDLGFPSGSVEHVSLYDWLFMIEFLSSHSKENNFFGQYARALNKFGYMEEDNEDGDEEEEEWEKSGSAGYSDAMSKVRVQGLDTTKEKVKVRSVKRVNSFKRENSATSFDLGGDEEEKKELESLTKKGNLDALEKARVTELMVTKKVEEQMEELMSKGQDMTEEDKAKIKELMKEQAAAKDARMKAEEEAEEVSSEVSDQDLNHWAGGDEYDDEEEKLDDVAKLNKATHAAGMLFSGKTQSAYTMESSIDKRLKAAINPEDSVTRIKGGLKGLGNDSKSRSKMDVLKEGKEKESVKFDKDASDEEEEEEAVPPEDDDPSSSEDEAEIEAMREAARRARVVAEGEENRMVSLIFEKYSAEGYGGAPLEDAGFIRGQRVLIQALSSCGLDPSSDLRLALLVDSFITALLQLPTNTEDVHAGNILISRDQFMRLLEQARRFVARQKKVTREDLEPEEIFIISDPQGYGFITLKRVRKVVRSMGMDPQHPRVANELTKLGKECAEDNYVVTYDRFIVFVERLRMEVLGMGLAVTLDVDLSKAARMAAKDLKQTRKTMHEAAKQAAQNAGMHFKDKDVDNEVSGKDYVASLNALLEQTKDWESKPAGERERALHLLRVHAVEASRRKQAEDQATIQLESKINLLHDRAMRQTKYAREYAIDKLKAEAGGVPPTPRAPARPKEPPLTSAVLDQIAARKRAFERDARREVLDQVKDEEFKRKNNVPQEPGHAPSAGVFDKIGYMKELKEKANVARKEFEHKLKHTPNERGALEQSARSAIRLYSQICNMEPVPSAATYQIGLIHKRLGNDEDAMKCFDTVIDIDPDGRHGDTAHAWDVKGMMIIAQGGKRSDAAFCFERALQLKPSDVLIRKHLRDCESQEQDDKEAVPPKSPKTPKRSKSKKEKKNKLGPRPPSFGPDDE